MVKKMESEEYTPDEILEYRKEGIQMYLVVRVLEIIGKRLKNLKWKNRGKENGK